MKNLKSTFSLVFIFWVFMLTGCGGGGGSSSSANSNPSSPVVMDGSNGGVPDGAVNVSRSPSMVLSFISAMDPATVNKSTVLLTTVPVIQANLVSNAENQTELNDLTANATNSTRPLFPLSANATNTIFSTSPVSPLSSNTKYYVTITSGAKNISGGSVTGQFSFTTGDFIAPTVVIISPSNNATNVSTSPSIQLQFSAPVLNVNATTISLREGSLTGLVIPIGQITTGPDNMFTFSSVSELNDSTQYFIVLTGGISDISSNQLSPISFNFTTGDLAHFQSKCTTDVNCID